MLSELLNEQVGIDYPPAPWHETGEAWMGVFRADRPLDLPVGLTPIASQRVILLLVRYRSGTLVYDELAVGSLVRQGLKPGLWIHHMWVNDPHSMAGGQHLWGMPKQLATFTWHGDQVRIHDADGMIASFRIVTRRGFALPIIGVLPTLGQRHGFWLWMVARMRSKIRPAHFSIETWSDRFPFHLNHKPALGIHILRFKATFAVPYAVHAEAA